MCSEFNVVCQHEVSMEVHIGKQHSEKFECGLCDLEESNFKNLELHLTTWEMYRCQRCEIRYKPNQIRDLKKHIVDIHQQGAIEHLKLDRNDCNEVVRKLRNLQFKFFIVLEKSHDKTDFVFRTNPSSNSYRNCKSQFLSFCYITSGADYYL